MKTALFKAVLGSILMLLLMFACTLALRFYKTIVPEHVERDTINFTASDLKQARRKWAADGIARYSMKLLVTEAEYPQEEITLVVDEEARTIDIVDYYIGNEHRFDYMGTYPVDDYHDLTIPGLFDAASERLANKVGGAAAPDEDGMSKYHDYWVAFDPTYGFPAEVSDYERSTFTTREIVWRTTLTKFQVKDFKPLD